MPDGARPARPRLAVSPLAVSPPTVSRSAGWARYGTAAGSIAASADVAYEGSPLARGSRYAWKVRVWDESLGPLGLERARPGSRSSWTRPTAGGDRGSGWARPGRGSARRRGLPDPVAKALTPVPYLRRAFVLDSRWTSVASARLYVTALGLYEARLNGGRVGDAVLAPGWTDYARRVPYQTYDVTGLLREGENVIGALLADGWYAGFVGFDAKRAGAHYGTAPELLAQLVITFADGTASGWSPTASWRGRPGAIRHADLLMGERHDLALEPGGWDAPGFDAAAGAASGAGTVTPAASSPTPGRPSG